MDSEGLPDDNSVEFWKKKSLNLERVIKTLSDHCVKVIGKHEEMLIDFKKNQEQFKKLKEKYQEKGNQIKKARDVLIPVSNELKSLREKYEIAVRCQLEAETYAVKTSNKNLELKRQSQKIFTNLASANIVDINIDEFDEEDTEEKEYIENLGQQIDELAEAKSVLALQVKEINENYQLEKEANSQLKAKIEQMKVELKQACTVIQQQEELLEKVEKTSEKAFIEYEDMEQTYRKEVKVRGEAERFAHRLTKERDQARRESALALSKVADDKKLMDAMLEIQELNSKVAEIESGYEKKIWLLEDQLKTAKDIINSDNLDTENEELQSEKSLLQEKLEKSETEIKQLRTRYEELQETYQKLETKYENATKLPPPPPPPAPPPPPVTKSGGFLERIIGKKGKRDQVKEQLKKGGVTADDGHSKAVEEMMKRIKSGNLGLKPTLKNRSRSLPEEEKPSAMEELQGLLTKMKKCRSEDDLSVFGDNNVKEESELGKILLRRQKAMQETKISEPPPQPQPKSRRPVPQPRKLSAIQDEAEET